MAMHHHHSTSSALRHVCRAFCGSPEVQLVALESEEDLCSLCGRLGMFRSSPHAQTALNSQPKKDLFLLPPVFQSPLNPFGVLEEPSLEPLGGIIGSTATSSMGSSSGSRKTIGSAFSSAEASAAGSVETTEGAESSSSGASSRSSFSLDTGTTTVPSHEDIVVMDDSGSSSVASSSGSFGTLCPLSRGDTNCLPAFALAGPTDAITSMGTHAIVSIASVELGIMMAVFAVLLYSRRRTRRLRKQAKDEDFSEFVDLQPTISLVMSQTGGSLRRSSFRQPSELESDWGQAFWEDPVIVRARIPRDQVDAEALIDRGGFGLVYHGHYGAQVIAAKMMVPEIQLETKYVNAFLKEIRIMASLEHERVVRFVGVAWTSLSDLCAITEFVDGGDLDSLLERFEREERRPHGFDADKLKIALQLAEALAYLHSLQPIVMHRDLKSMNILLTQTLDVKLADFGIARHLEHDRCMTPRTGTSLWMAPEIILGEQYDEKVDVFSFGIVLTEMDSHQLPYANVDPPELVKRTNQTDSAILMMVARGNLRAKFSAHVTGPLRQLGEQCLALDPTQRPTAAELVARLHQLI